jgi:multidrug resistance efflux pump
METHELELKTPPGAEPILPEEKKKDGRSVKSTWNSLKTMLRVSFGVAAALALLIVIANWAVVPQIFPKTSVSVVNAHLIVQRMSIEGEVRITSHVGDTVKQGDVLASTENTYLNEAPVWRLKTEQANLQAEVSRFSTDLATAIRLRNTARAELGKFRTTLVRELACSLRQADAKMAELTTARDQAKRLAELARKLAQRAATPKADYDKALEDAAIAQARLEQSGAEREALANQLEGAKMDVYTQRDTPIYLTLYLQFQQAVAATEAKVVETRKQLESTDRELARVDSFERLMAAAAVRSPVSGEVWRVTTSSDLGKGESVFEIAESQNAFVEAQFQESFAPSIHRGAKAIIKVSGLPPFTGTVRTLRQTSPSELDSANAMRLPRQLNQLKVYIDADRPKLLTSLLGRQCRVLIADRDVNMGRFAEWLSVKLFLLLGW